MGPTNVALVKLYQADMKLREVQGRLDAVSRNVRIQERKVADLAEKLKLAQTRLREGQMQSSQFDLDLKTRDAHIEKLRTQQTNAKNNKEYQAFLIEINTEKVEKTKVEEQMLKTMESVEKQQAEVKELSELLDAEKSKLTSMQAEIGERVAALKAEIEQIRPLRDAAHDAVPPKAVEAFDRMSDRMEGEALSPLTKPDRRREEYTCGACQMGLVTDVYNKLHSRDDLIFCPSCKRILYIPDDLPPEMAIGNTAPTKASAKAAASKSGASKTDGSGALKLAKPRAAKKARGSKLTQQQAVAKFLAWFPGGFRDNEYLNKERGILVEAHATWLAELGGNKAEQLLAEGAIGELIRKTDLAVGELPHLSRLDRVALRDAINDEASARLLFAALLPLLAAETPTADLFDVYAGVARELPQRGAKVGAWPVLTFLPFIARPDRFLWTKPDVIAEAAARVGSADGKLDSTPNWNDYQRVLRLGALLLSELKAHGASDMIDVACFLAVVADYASTRPAPAPDPASEPPAGGSPAAATPTTPATAAPASATNPATATSADAATSIKGDDATTSDASAPAEDVPQEVNADGASPDGVSSGTPENSVGESADEKAMTQA
jgi:predicted  nucleic acid-binding Zn-ribbon protein